MLEFNPAAERAFGYRAEDVLGEDLADLLIPPQLREDHRRGLQRHLEHGGGRLVGAQVELTGMRASGELFPIELAVTRIETDDLPLFAGGCVPDVENSGRAPRSCAATGAAHRQRRR